jgi:hypothetical protein
MVYALRMTPKCKRFQLESLTTTHGTESVMRIMFVYLTVVLSEFVISSVNAQCNRGGMSGSRSTAIGITTPMISSTTFSSPMAMYNPTTSGPVETMLVAQYRSRLARQQYLALQQQRYLQERARQQRNLEQFSELRSAEDGTSGQEPSYADVRREKSRQRNAERAFELAEKASANGRLTTAKKQYRRVIRILGDSDRLGRLASDALIELAPRGRESPRREELLAFRVR